jgi:hypothetical protein
MPRPDAACPGCHDPVALLFRVNRWHSKVAAGYSRLHNDTQPAQRFVESHMFLGLVGQDVRQAEAVELAH